MFFFPGSNSIRFTFYMHLWPIYWLFLTITARDDKYNQQIWHTDTKIACKINSFIFIFGLPEGRMGTPWGSGPPTVRLLLKLEIPAGRSYFRSWETQLALPNKDLETARCFLYAHIQRWCDRRGGECLCVSPSLFLPVLLVAWPQTHGTSGGSPAYCIPARLRYYLLYCSGPRQFA